MLRTAVRYTGVLAEGAPVATDTPIQVLVVEDDAATREVLAESLHELGYAVTPAGTASAARAAVRFDVALLDLHLPDASGLVVLQEWRERGIDAPVLIITADRGAEAIDQALVRLDAWDYLPKPFDLATLERAMKDAITRAGERRRIERRLAG